MPRQNRVTPLSELIATEARGTLMGNRGCLHDDQGQISGRRWATHAWVICLLSFKDRKRQLMQPGRYTELFFLDEATALAAGHRPCGECRHADHHAFRAAWWRGNPVPTGMTPGSLSLLDRTLHTERTARMNGEAFHEPLADLPDGTMIILPGQEGCWLVLGDELARWSPEGYTERVPRPGEEVAVITPPSTVRAIRAGFEPGLHPTAND